MTIISFIEYDMYYFLMEFFQLIQWTFFNFIDPDYAAVGKMSMNQAMVDCTPSFVCDKIFCQYEPS
jgi:hypothetical protein